MALTLSAADSALKEDYQPAIREQINQKVMLLAQVEKNTTDIEGRRAVLSVHVQRNAGVGARGDGGALPNATSQGYSEERVPLKYNYGRIQVSGPTIRAMKSDRGSFTRAVDSETRGITNDLKRDVNRQVAGTGDSKIATCGTTSGSTTVTLASTTSAVQMRQLEVGMVIDIGTVANPTAVVAGATIQSTSPTASPPTITIDSSVTTSSSHFVFRQGSAAANVSYELNGLQSIVKASGTLFNLDPTQAKNASWVATVDSNGGTKRQLTETLLAKNIHAVNIAGGEDVNLFLTSDGVFRSYANNLTALKRFQNELNLKGGFTALSVTAGGSEVGLTWERDVPNNTCFGVNTDHLVEFQMSDWEFMQEDGAVLSRVPGFDIYDAVLFKYHELATDKRNAHVQIQDLLEA